MSSTSSPTVSRRWLALEMRRLREERDLSQRAVAKALGCQVPKVSLMETNQRPVQVDDLKVLLELFGVSDEDHQQYFDEAQNAQEKGWWEREPYDEGVPRSPLSFIGLEQGADRIRTYAQSVIHGLLQTPAYAAEICRGLVAGWSEEKVNRRVELRRRRQRMLFEPRSAPDLQVVLDEAVLHRVVGNRDVMGAQLDHVVELCRDNKHITVRIMPFERGGAYEMATGPFTILGFGFQTDPGVVYMEHHSSALFLDELADIDKYSVLFDRLSELALSPEDSSEMLRRSADDYKRGA